MVKNDEGYVKCLNAQGRVVWIGDHIASNAVRMSKMGLELAPEPIKLEPIINVANPHLEEIQNTIESNDIHDERFTEVLLMEIETPAPKKRGRKPKIN